MLQSLIFLIWCGRNPIIYDDPAPLSSFQYPSSIKSLMLALFNSVLGPKKSFESGSRTWAEPLSRQDSLLSH
jgi:hypothetical protein